MSGGGSADDTTTASRNRNKKRRNKTDGNSKKQQRRRESSSQNDHDHDDADQQPDRKHGGRGRRTAGADVARGGDTIGRSTYEIERIKNDEVPSLTTDERSRYDAYMNSNAPPEQPPPPPTTDSDNNKNKNKKNEKKKDGKGKKKKGDDDEDDVDDGDVDRLPMPPTPHQKRAMERRRKYSAKQQSRIARVEHKRQRAAVDAAQTSSILDTQHVGYLEAESLMERTYRVTQEQLKKDFLDENTARHIYDINLTECGGPYGMKYDRSGRFSLLYGKGRGGHVAVMDCQARSLRSEIFLGANEVVRDATFLHNGSMFATAQKKRVYIYDGNTGAEIHELEKHDDRFCVEFLPYHWLLASVGRSGWLRYHDTSTGEHVSEHRTKLGPCRTMRQNPQNAIMHLGHGNGTVTLWSPASSECLVKMLCHRGPVLDVAVDPSGRYMATAGADLRIKMWDLRTYQTLYSYPTPVNRTPVTSLDFSQRGVLGMAHGHLTTFWNNPLGISAPPPTTKRGGGLYMSHKMGGLTVETLRFRPYEDVCGLGHSGGVSSIVIPGSGEPNLDSLEPGANPYADAKQRREGEVRALLDKLSPDMIALDPDSVGRIARRDKDETRGKRETMERADHANTGGRTPLKGGGKEKNRMRGRNKLGKKLARKQKNVLDANFLMLREAREREKEEVARSLAAKRGEVYLTEKEKKKADAPAALKRFFD